MVELKCSEYTMLDSDEQWSPCNCPVCGGFLKAFSIDEKLSCKKCGTELLIIPDKDEETGKEWEWGKICPISERKRRTKK